MCIVEEPKIIYSDKKPKKKKKGKHITLKIIAISVLCLILVMGGTGLFAINYLLGRINHVDDYVYDNTVIEPEEDQPDYPEGSDVILDGSNIPIRNGSQGDITTILLIGSDRRNQQVNGLSDVMILLTVDNARKTVKMTSIGRDLYVNIPGRDSTRINHSHSYGGPKLLLDTIEQNLRLKVDKYISVDFSSFQGIIDRIGGVDIALSEKEATYLGYTTGAGTYHLTGSRALSYARIRKIDTDINRTGRQREVLNAIQRKAKKMSAGDIISLMYDILPLVTTNLSKSEILTFAMDASTFLSYDTQEMVVPAAGTYQGQKIRGMALLVADMPANIKQMQEFIFGDFIGPPDETTTQGSTAAE